MPIALAFSGGGWRAALTAAGVVRFLADVGLLERVRLVSSVSGGSITNGLLANSYLELERAGYSPAAVDECVVEPLYSKVSGHSLAWRLITHLWRALVPGKTRTDVLADALDEWFFGARTLESLPGNWRFIINAANVTTGVRFGFEREVYGDYVMGLTSTGGSGLRLADAVAASAAVPGPFAPMSLDASGFPCREVGQPQLLDGGVYDNLGLEPLDHRRLRFEGKAHDAFLIALSAGGVLRTGYRGFTRHVPLVRELKRSEDLLYRQTTALRTSTMVERFRAFEQATRDHRTPPDFARYGVLFGLATSLSAPPDWPDERPQDANGAEALAETHTSFGRFPASLCDRLIYRGWWLTGAVLWRFHREMLPQPLPRWRAL